MKEGEEEVQIARVESFSIATVFFFFSRLNHASSSSLALPSPLSLPMAPPQQHSPLPLAVRSALARLQGEEARALASHPQLRRLAAAAAFDAALDLNSSSSSGAPLSSSSSEASRALDTVFNACLSHWSEVRSRG